MTSANPQAGLFAGLLSGTRARLDRARAALEREWGSVALSTEPRAWNESAYYEPEMGPGLLRQFLAFEKPVAVGDLAAIKRRAVAIERELAVADGDPPVARPVNIDPGLLDAHNVTLASTKRGGHRVWTGDGIWAEITLVYQAGGYAPVPWTYADFKWPGTLEFLAAFRKLILPRLAPP